jgi:hypothetical protein
LTTTQKFLLAAGLAVLSAVVSLLVVGIVAVRLPADYFVDPKRRTFHTDHPALRILKIVLKNLLGLVLVALGIALSVPGVPGQGLLTIFLGILLLDFPGKYRVERWFLRRPAILGAINRLRARWAKPPLQLP